MFSFVENLGKGQPMLTELIMFEILDVLWMYCLFAKKWVLNRSTSISCTFQRVHPYTIHKTPKRSTHGKNASGKENKK